MTWRRCWLKAKVANFKDDYCYYPTFLWLWNVTDWITIKSGVCLSRYKSVDEMWAVELWFDLRILVCYWLASHVPGAFCIADSSRDPRLAFKKCKLWLQSDSSFTPHDGSIGKFTSTSVQIHCLTGLSNSGCEAWLEYIFPRPSCGNVVQYVIITSS